MMMIQVRFDVLREMLLLVCILVVMGSALGALRIDHPGFWFAVGCVPAVLWSSYRVQKLDELELSRLMRLTMAAFTGGVLGANIRWLICALVG